MPEYLSPGVYVEEIETVTKPIPGVSTSTEYALLQSLAEELRQTIPVYAAARLLELSVASAAAGESPKRPSYFGGQLLDAATLQAEQDYFRGKLRRHNRRLHGFGIVSGLGVSVSPPDDQDDSRIIVEPGCAIDRAARKSHCPAAATLALPAGYDELFVTLRFWEHPCPESRTSESDNPCFPCVEEVCVIGIGSDIPTLALPIARLLRLDDCWTVDAEFVAPRVT